MTTRKRVLVILAVSLVIDAVVIAILVARWPGGQEPLPAESTEGPPPVLEQAPSFTLTDQAGEPFSTAALEGKIWVADFFFTSCPGPCPVMSSNLAILAERFGPELDVSFVSISVDPETDTPAVLREYAQKYGAKPGQWHFLTGDLSKIQELGEAFFLGAPGEPVHHSTRFILVDSSGKVRGYYTGVDDEQVAELSNDIGLLIEERRA